MKKRLKYDLINKKNRLDFIKTEVSQLVKNLILKNSNILIEKKISNTTDKWDEQN